MRNPRRTMRNGIAIRSRRGIKIRTTRKKSIIRKRMNFKKPEKKKLLGQGEKATTGVALLKDGTQDKRKKG